jgi:FkbM family methyltransferase
MNPLFKLTTTLGWVANHPMCRHDKLGSMAKFCIAQVASRLIPGDVCVEFPKGIRLLVSPKMKGAAHFIFPGLSEFDEMMFVVHSLSPGDLFVDVGANVGAFSVLASGVANAHTIAFEPSPGTFQRLQQNIRLNGLQEKVAARNKALGGRTGKIEFTEGLGTENRVTDRANRGQTVEVELSTLDHELRGEKPVLIKIDVEGFESEVLSGSGSTLTCSSLCAMIIERNDSGDKYGFDEAALHSKIKAAGFTPCTYHAERRLIEPVTQKFRGNIIYLRDVQASIQRLQKAPRLEFGRLCI